MVAFGASEPVRERDLRHAGGGGRVAHVEQRDLGAGRAAVLGGVLADAEEAAVADRVQVRGVAEDLELAGDRGAAGSERSSVYRGSVRSNVTT